MLEVDTSPSMDNYDFIKCIYEDRIQHIEFVLAKSAK